MKYVNQKKYPEWTYITGICYEGEAKEKGLKTTVSSSGCGLCSAVMVADRLLPNCEFSLEDAMRISYDNRANRYNGTFYRVFAPAFAEECGLDLEMTSDPQRLRYCLRTGGAAVLHTKGNQEGYVSVFTKTGHYVVAISEERDGRIAILDPAYVEGKFDMEGRKGLVELKNDVVAVCDMDVIVKDTRPADPCFYLFWRK